MVTIKIQTCADLPFFTVREIKRTTDHLNAIALNRKLTRARHLRHLTVLGRFQQVNHLFFAVRHVWFKVHHTAIDCRRELPDFPINTGTDLLIQVDTVNHEQHSKDNKQFYQEPEPTALFTWRATIAIATAFSFTWRHRFLVFIIIIVIRVIFLFTDTTTAYFLFHRT